MNYCYFNGNIVEEGSATLSVNDLGVLRGYAVFDFMRTYNGKIFMFDDHFARLTNSAAITGLKMPFMKDSMEKAVYEVMKMSNVVEAGIKAVITGGTSNDGFTYEPSNTNYYIIVKAIKKHPESMYKEGAEVITAQHVRTLPSAKTTDYVTALSLQKKKNDAGAVEILYLSNNRVLEASTSNFFIFKNNTLLTQKTDILPGITKKFVMQIAKDYFEVLEKDLAVGDLSEATEAFITGTLKEILPIVRIDGKKVGPGNVGENTKKLMTLFREKVSQY